MYRLLTILLAVTLGYAGEDNLTVLTVEKALELASSNNPQINQLRQKLNQTRARLRYSTGITDPRFTIMKEGIGLDSGSGFEEKRWTVSQSLDFPLTSFFRLRGIAHEIHAMEYNLESAIRALKAEVKTRYTELIYAREIKNLRLQQLKLADQLNVSAITLFEVGQASRLDLMKSELQRAESQNDLEEAEEALLAAQYQFLILLGLDPGSRSVELIIPDSLVYQNIELNEQRVLETIGNQPRILEMDQLLAAESANIRLAWSQFLPVLDISYYRQDYGTGYNFYGYELGLSVPVWFLFHQRGQIQEARARKNQQQWVKKETSLEMKRDIEIAWNGYKRSKGVIDRYKNLIRNRSFTLRDLTMEGYQEGELELLDLLEAQRTFLNNEKRYYDALRDYYIKIIEMEKYLQQDLIFIPQNRNGQS